MDSKKILLDTNVILDYLLTREGFADDAKEIFGLCADGKIIGCIAAHTVTNIFFILRRDFDPDERRTVLMGLLDMFDVIDIDAEKLRNGLDNNNFEDFEDCLQYECAKDFGAEYIVTRNIKDFSGSSVPPILPKDFLETLR